MDSTGESQVTHLVMEPTDRDPREDEDWFQRLPPDVQQIMADHFKITEIALAPGETAYDPKPTSLPTPRSGQLLRSELDAIRLALDPFAVAPGMNNAMIVGHSMGGILTRSILVDVGRDLWDAVFTMPLHLRHSGSSSRPRKLCLITATCQGWPPNWVSSPPTMR